MNPPVMLTRLFHEHKARMFMLLALLAGFALMLPLQWLTPMHSDDYAYTHKGITWAATWKHYTTWSGRLVADFLSSAVLVLRNHAFAATLNTLAFVAFIFIIWWLPRFELSRPASSKPAANPTSGSPSKPWVAARAFALLFLLYWLGSPALGENIFWIVGSANYVWTNALHLLFLGLFLREALESRPSQAVTSRLPARSILTLLLAPIAGCSNENTSVTTTLLLGLVCLHVFFVHGERRWRAFNWKLPAYALAFALGAAALLLAPGNQIRKQIFLVWNRMGWDERAALHFTERVPLALHHLGLVFLAALALLLIAQRLKWHNLKQQNALAWLFMLAATCSLTVLVASPILPQRALAGTLTYVLLAISCVLASPDMRAVSLRLQKTLNAFTLALALVFAVSYGLMLRAYHQVTQQNAVRQQIIHEGMARGDVYIFIPKFHWLPLLRDESEHFTEFFNDEMMSWYEGTRAAIRQFDVSGPYSTVEQARAMLSPAQRAKQQATEVWGQEIRKRPR